MGYEEGGYILKEEKTAMRKSRILNRQSKRVVQLALDPAARAVAFQQEVRALTERAVLELALDILDNEVNHLYGRLYRHNTAREYYRHGSQMGGVTVCGQRLRLERPRVRKKRRRRGRTRALPAAKPPLSHGGSRDAACCSRGFDPELL